MYVFLSLTFLPLLVFFCASYMPISGFQGALSGFLVGMKQIIPDQELSVLRIKAKVCTFT
uniref:Transmembrane protein 115-like n=1 Tax=Rhizophora mucronata TaxID=61149 RepID=A0A2P2LIX7_RHIMU